METTPAPSAYHATTRLHNDSQPRTHAIRSPCSNSPSFLPGQAQLGNRWCAIADLLPGRTEATVKNRYYSALRRIQRASRCAADEAASLLRRYALLNGPSLSQQQEAGSSKRAGSGASFVNPGGAADASTAVPPPVPSSSKNYNVSRSNCNHWQFEQGCLSAIRDARASGQSILGEL